MAGIFEELLPSSNLRRGRFRLFACRTKLSGARLPALSKVDSGKELIFRQRLFVTPYVSFSLESTQHLSLRILKTKLIGFREVKM